MASKSTPPKHHHVSFTRLLGATLRVHRRRAGRTQLEVATALGIGQPAYSRLERGTASLSVLQLARAEECLGASPADMLRSFAQARVALLDAGYIVLGPAVPTPAGAREVATEHLNMYVSDCLGVT